MRVTNLVEIYQLASTNVANICRQTDICFSSFLSSGDPKTHLFPLTSQNIFFHSLILFLYCITNKKVTPPLICRYFLGRLDLRLKIIFKQNSIHLVGNLASFKVCVIQFFDTTYIFQDI